ncbi:DUF2243 domain-containing protein [Falsirhodobacter deserti]|uniref:DUF2243 domain-containing protein n=1 Tax=Falsirhodobacter deserti TaxID=1365611 RepID=UPI000FE36640|nr:DUF2243 domain-containing protein [Falsirhodobacter deserti]
MAPTPAGQAHDTRRSLLAAFLLGAGIMAGVDEILFHQILRWHHFFDRSTPAIAIISDGLLHSAELILMVLGFLMFNDLRRRTMLSAAHAKAGFMLGLGAFQLFDGIVNHKILQLHQVRYVDPVWAYDLAWNAVGAALLICGLALLRRARG